MVNNVVKEGIGVGGVKTSVDWEGSALGQMEFSVNRERRDEGRV